MSPELCSGAEYSVAADIWATGCLLYEVMTLQSPWESVIENLAFREFQLCWRRSWSSPSYDVLTSRYPPKIVRTVRWMLCKTVEKRLLPNNSWTTWSRDLQWKIFETHWCSSLHFTHLRPRKLEPVTHSEEPVIKSMHWNARQLLEEAMNLVKAANVIQRSFRLSKQMRDQRFEIADKMVPRPRSTTSYGPSSFTAGETFNDPHLPPLTAHNDASVVIQRLLVFPWIVVVGKWLNTSSS